MSTPTIASRLDGLDRFVERSLKDWRVPGAAVGIVKGRRMIYAKGFGLRDVKRRLPVTETTLFGIASCTKAFTATAIGILVDDGKLEWDTPIRDVMPSFRMHDPVATERLTPRDLLTHRSGLPRHDMAWYTSTATRAELLDTLRHLKPSTDLRSAFQYNNLMFITAGALVEHVSGRTWEEFLDERIFEPLGMHATRCWHSALPEPEEFAVGHERKRDRVVAVPRRKSGVTGPAGSIVSNVVDLCRWVCLQMDRGKAGQRRIISEKSLSEIHSPQIVAPGRAVGTELLDACYGMGWFIQPYRGRRMIQHPGSSFGFNASVSFMPAESIGVVVLTNISSSPLELTIRLNVYDRLLGLDPIPWNARKKREAARQRAKPRKRTVDRERKRGTHPSHLIEDYVGDYRHPGYGRLSLSVEKGRLKVAYGERVFRLTHYHYDVFQLAIGADKRKASFLIDKAGRIESVAIPFEPAVDDIIFRRIPT